MWSWIKWAVGVREKETGILNHNDMSPLPKRKFVNYARTKEPVDEDSEPHQSIYHLKRMERLHGKSKKRKSQLERYYDYYNY